MYLYMEDQVTQNYYSSKTIQEFYLNVWGGDSIHIGIYKDDYVYSSSRDRQDKINDIRASANAKKELIFDSMKNFYQDLHLINIADFGAGYGGTSRYLYNKLKEENKIFTIDCFDISKENCMVNTEQNIFNNCDINVLHTSFLNIPFSKKYNVIYSEDAFIHINDRELIFKQISKILLKNGLLIFSDIILTDNHHKNDLQEVYDRIGITNIETTNSYIQKALKYNLKLLNEVEYKESMLLHYTNVKDCVDNKPENQKILVGLKSWIKHISLGNITTKLFVFKKL